MLNALDRDFEHYLPERLKLRLGRSMIRHSASVGNFNVARLACVNAIDRPSDPTLALLHRQALRKVARLIDIGALQHSHVVRQQLHGYGKNRRRL